MKAFNKTISLWSFFLIAILLAIIIFSSNHLWHEDLLVHTDVARDLLVLREMVETKQPTLIGPRSSMPGIFHGPLWYYICLIPFILSHGDPILMGWTWWFFGASATGLFFYFCQKITKNLSLSLLATICFALLELPSAAGPTNTYFANLFAFVPFILCWKWLQNPSFWLAAAGWLSFGILVQFQMAFAVPLAMLWGLIFLWQIYRSKNLPQILALFFFFLPLLTFVLFDLRHDWLQLRSLGNYLQNKPADTDSFFIRMLERTGQAFLAGGNLFGLAAWLNLIILGTFAYLALLTKEKKVQQLVLLVGYFYFAWWILTTLVFSGTIWNFYYDPFLSIILITLVMIANQSKKAQILFTILVLWLLVNSFNKFTYSEDRFDSSSWQLLSKITADALREPETGYFLYSQDQFAYPLKYAFAFYRQQHPESKATGFSKKPLTVLVKAADNPDNPFSTSKDWQLNKLRISLQPIETIIYPHEYVLEKYHLDEATLQSGVDPNLVVGLEFR